jgi:hypothetical protein
MSIHLHIDSLVLDGLSLAPTDAAAVKEALAGELMRLLSGYRIAASFGAAENVPWVGGNAIGLGPDIHPVPLGQSIAGAVFKGVMKRP